VIGMLRGVVLQAAAAWFVPRPVRWAILRACGLKVDTRAICARTTFTGPDVAIGHGSFVNCDCFFDAMAPISLGKGVSVGMDVLFATSTHRIGPASGRAGELTSAPIRVEDGVWIGARAVLLPGVTVGAGCVIAAGAVVASDCEPNGLYGGVPARRIRELDAESVASRPALRVAYGRG
jgi:maltose O-acetyltransferase